MIPAGALQFAPSTVASATELAELRALAMKPSLTRLARYDETRVRSRFLETFSAEHTTQVLDDGLLAAFFVLREKADHLLLDHLYVHPDWQGQNIGRQVINHVIDQSTQKGLPVRLMALKESPANQFYQSCGFHKTGETAFDILYERPLT